MGMVFALVLGALSMSGCQTAAAGLSDAERAKFKEQAQRTMRTINARDFAAWAADFTDDAEWLAPNAPVVRKRDSIQANAASGPVMSDLVLNQVDVDGQGTLAYVRGDYTLNVTPPGAAPIADKGKYIEIYRKQADGSWKASKVIFNSDIPLPPPPPAPKKK